MSNEIGPEQAKINAHFAAIQDDLSALDRMFVCDRCGVKVIVNALCDRCLAIRHQPNCGNTGWGHAAYCKCNANLT